MKHFKQTHISELWLKAASIGSIWAANEIILGSFLHNLRIPLSGTVMSFLSVVFVVAFSKMWPERGLIWRAGVIAALMKSLSPSAIIFGPMIGIMAEAFILELVLYVFGHRLPSYILAGALAVVFVLIQKIGTVVITYGLDIILIFEQMYDYSIRQFHWEHLEVKYAVMALFAIYILIGMTGGFVGYLTGRRAQQLGQKKNLDFQINKDSFQSLFEYTTSYKYSAWLLLLHISVLILGFYIINNAELVYIVVFLGVYIAFSIYHYGNSFKHLRKPSFWIFFIVITLLAGFLMPGEDGEMFSMAGLIVGVKMNIRAAFVLLSFAAISKELKNPIIKSILYKRGFANLYQAMELAFMVLPASISAFPKVKNMIRQPVQSIAELILYLEVILEMVKEKHNKLPPIIIISGNIQEGKTTFVEKVIKRLARKNIKTAGFLAKVIYDGENRTGYQLKDLSSPKSELLCTIEKQADWEH